MGDPDYERIQDEVLPVWTCSPDAVQGRAAGAAQQGVVSGVEAAEEMSASVTISIVTYTALSAAKRCIASVMNHSHDYRLILTANGNLEAARYFDVLSLKHSGVRVVVNETNEGFISPNRRALEMTDTPLFCMVNDDTLVCPRWLDMLRKPFQDFPMAALSGPIARCTCLTDQMRGVPGPRLEYLEGSCLMGRTSLLKEHGLFDPNLCVAPDTMVLMSDLRWRRIDSLSVGDELIACDEYPETTKKGAARRLKAATVLGLVSRETECVRITLEDGTSVVCSTQHRWLTKKPIPAGSKQEWRKAHELKKGFRMVVPFRVWGTETSYDSGWLSGIFDGEGFVRVGGRKSGFNNNNSSVGVGMVQLPGLVLSRTEELLGKMGIEFIRRLHSQGRNKPVYNLEINKRKWGMELIGRLRPVRLMDKARMLWENRSIRSRLSGDLKSIASIEPIGMHPVISMGTSTQTFIANGIVSHNCFCYGEDSDLSLRMRQLGYTIHQVPFRLPFHAGGATTRTVPNLKPIILANHHYLMTKWAAYLANPDRKFPHETK